MIYLPSRKVAHWNHLSKLYLSFPVKDATAVVQLINEDLAKIATWCCYNSLLINPDKTKLLVMGNCQMLLRLPKDFHITLLGKEVTPFNSARDLCIEMDATQSFDEHITNTVSSCFTSLCQINRIKHLFDLKSLEKPGYKSAAGKWSFLYRSVTMWNSLPTAITDCNNLAMFMRKSKDYLFRLYLIFQIVNCIIIRWLLYIYKLGLNALLS